LIVEIYISSAWQRLTWRQGDSPVVRNEYESSRLFQFVAPIASISVFDKDSKFRQGGSLEIQKDQEIRIFSGQGEVEIFKGVVDRDIRFTPADEVLRFSAVGWLARIKRYLAGRRLDHLVGDVVLDSANTVIGSVADDDWALRYIREYTDSNAVAQVEVVYANTYDELLPENRKVSLRKRHIFDSRLYDVNFSDFQTENEDPAVFTAGDFDGLFTRTKTGGFFKSVSFDIIIAELVKQINVRLSDFTSTLSKGEISGNINIRLIDNVFGTIDYFTRFLNNEIRLFAIGWGSNDGLPANSGVESQRLGVGYSGSGNGGIGAGITLYNVINKFDPIIKIDSENFSGGWEEAFGRGFKRNAYDENGNPISFGNMPDDSLINKFVLSRVSPSDREDHVTIYMLWSWISIRGVAGGSDYLVNNDVMAQWHTFDLTSGTLVGSSAHYQSFPSTGFISYDRIIPDGFAFPSLLRSATISNPTSFVRGGATFSLLSPYPLSPEIDTESGTHYSIDDGVPFASGNITLDSMQFDFQDTPIVEVLLEICKLTNSVLYIDKDKNIKIVSRDYSSSAHNLREDVVIQTTSRVTSNFGDRVPNISSEIIVRDAHLAVLKDFYADQEFPDIDDVWVLKILENDTTAAIELLDTVKFPNIGFGENITPAIVRSMQFSEGEITMTVSRSQ
jgi:hypothetical protein